MQYKAFISYSHAEDAGLARALESALRLFAKPWYLATAFRRRIGRQGSQDKFLTFVRVWDVRAAKELFTAPLSEPVFGKPASPISLSQDGRYLAIGLDDGQVSVYEPERGGQVSSRFPYGLVGFSADGRYLVTSGTDVESPTFRVYSTADLRYFATGRAADVAHIWNVANGQEVALVRHQPGSRPLSLSQDGSHLAVLEPDGTVRVSALDPEALIAEACGRLLRDLSSTEWKRFIGNEPQQSACARLLAPR